MIVQKNFYLVIIKGTYVPLLWDMMKTSKYDTFSSIYHIVSFLRMK